jgi:hypothetical protein
MGYMDTTEMDKVVVVVTGFSFVIVYKDNK